MSDKKIVIGKPMGHPSTARTGKGENDKRMHWPLACWLAAAMAGRSQRQTYLLQAGTVNGMLFCETFVEQVLPISVCSKCHQPNPRAPHHRYCTPCHNAYCKEWRLTHPLTPEQNAKQKARAFARSRKRRGKLTKEPCLKCGSENSQMHHDDYNKPAEVTWLCRPCHMAEHGH